MESYEKSHTMRNLQKQLEYHLKIRDIQNNFIKEIRKEINKLEKSE